jgi:hypothetical protein
LPGGGFPLPPATGTVVQGLFDFLETIEAAQLAAMAAVAAAPIAFFAFIVLRVMAPLGVAPLSDAAHA